MLGLVDKQLQACSQECEKVKQMYGWTRPLALDDQKKMETRLDQTIASLTVAVTCYNTKIIQETSRDIVYHSKAGVYPITAQAPDSPPAQVHRVKVYIKDDHMTITWNRNSNRDMLSGYEVRYNDTLNLVVPVPATCNSVTLGDPKVTPGHTYTVQVRAVNGRGPGEWSKHRTIYFKGPPQTPVQPAVRAYHKSAAVFVTIPGLAQCNGDAVCVVIVEYCRTSSHRWRSMEYDVYEHSAGHTIRRWINKLIPNTAYLFRVRLGNNYGDSRPSEAVMTQTL